MFQKILLFRQAPSRRDPYVEGVNSVVTIGTLTLGIAETPDVARAVINVHGANV
jgi:hypothetical protein